MKRKVVRTGAEALVQSIWAAGARIVFGYPGGNVLEIFNAVRHSQQIFVLGRHEQGCVHMADGYARATGAPAVVLVTSGPGLTNTITGLGCANMDGVPMVLVCGQVPLNEIGTDAFQEADTVGLTRAVSKHNFLVKSADEIPKTIAEAFYIATHGKPGPVVIDVPRDCQCALTSAVYPEKVVLRAYHPEVYASSAEVSKVARMLCAAKKPLIYAGGGVIAADTASRVRSLAAHADIPVATTMMGIGSISDRDQYALGMSGLYGTKAANAAVREADLVLALGVRFNDRSAFQTKAKIVQIDCDASAINKNIEVDVGVVADLADFLKRLLNEVPKCEHTPWVKHLSALRSTAHLVPVDPQTIVVTDVGEHQLWAVRNLQHTLPRHFLTSGGMGAMGFGIPAAIGAAKAHPLAKVIALVGDGGAQMTQEELIVAVEEKLNITFIVFANHTLGLVRTMQKEAYHGATFATKLRNPDFVLLAKAYGLKARRVKGLSALPALIAKAEHTLGAELVEVVI